MFGFDPIGMLADALKKAYLQMVSWFQSLMVHPPSIVGSSFRDYLFGNALGVYHYLAFGIAYVTFILALFIKKARVNFIHAVLILLLLAIVGPVWFSLTDQVRDFGNQLTVAASHLYVPPSGKSAHILPALSFADSMIAIMMLLPTLILSVLLYMTFAGYELIATVVQFIGLITLSLWALGDRVKKVFSMIISVGIVTMVIGRPTAMVFIGLGQGFISGLTGYSGDMMFIGAITIASLLLAFLFQFVLMFLTYKAVSPIVGKVLAAVKGTVEAINVDKFRLTTRAVNEAYTQSLQGRSHALNERPSSFANHAVRETAKAGIAMGAVALAAKAAASAHPAGKVASVVITGVHKATQNGRAKATARGG